MKIFRDYTNLEVSSGSAVTVGSFDGVHLGHRKIFEQLMKCAKENGLKSTIVTFDPHPRKVLGTAGVNLKLLTTLEEKIKIFKEIGIDRLLIIPFTREFSRLSPREFVETILVGKLKVREMVIGHDHHFGRDRQGGLEKLIKLGETHGFHVIEVPAITCDGELISSSVIRKHIEKGKMETVCRFLGRCYSLTGTVVKGDGRGKEMGFPTANLEISNGDKVIPRKGVYAVDINNGGRMFKGMMNIGHRPTFNFDSLTLEVHIFNFDAEIYGQKVEIYFKKYIREEMKFPNMEALKSQLEKDKEQCKYV